MTPRKIQDLACDHWGIGRVKLLSKQRQWKYVRPRQAVMYALYTYTDMSSTQIGRAMGGKDHTTVLHAIKRVQATLDNEVTTISGRLVYPDPSFAEDLREFMDRVVAMREPRVMILRDIIDSRESQKRVMQAGDFELPPQERRLPSVEEKRRAREREKAHMEMLALQVKSTSPFPEWARFDDNVVPSRATLVIDPGLRSSDIPQTGESFT